MEWRRLPLDPRTPLAWWWHEAGRLVGLGLGIVGIVSLLGILGFFLHAPGFLILIPGTFALGLLAIYFQYKLRAAHALASLAPSPAPAEIFPIDFSVFYQNVCTGRDQGVASVTEGWLHVEGLRTSFSLRPVDSTRVGKLSDGADVFELPGGQRIEVRALGSASDRATFGETIRIWHRFTIAPPTGEPTLPPLAVHATAILRPLSLLIVTLIFLVAVLIAAPILIATGHAVVLLTLVPALVIDFRYLSQAITGVRRLVAVDRLTRTSEETGPLLSTQDS